MKDTSFLVEDRIITEFYEVLLELAKKNCKLGDLETELVRDFPITNMRTEKFQKVVYQVSNP